MTQVCRICRSQGMRPYTVAKSWELDECPGCGHVQVRRQPTAAELDAIYSAPYFAHNKYSDLATLHHEYRRRLTMMQQYVATSAKVLDYGCAKADFIEFAGSAFQMHGVDYSADAIASAKLRLPQLANELYTLDEFHRIPNEGYDAIVMWDVIEHIWDVHSLMDELLPKLSRSGHLLLSTPRIDASFARITGRFWPFMTPPEHLGFFTEKAFRMLAKEHDLEMVYLKASGKLVNVGFLFYKLKRIFPRLIPAALINFFRTGRRSKWSVYVPTNDIQYVVLRKHASSLTDGSLTP